MSPVISTAILVCSVLVVEICHCSANDSLTCDKLPKLEENSIELLVANGPFITDFTLTPHYECSKRVFTHPANGTADSDGTVLVINGSEVDVFKYFYDNYTKTVKGTHCGTGEEFNAHILATQMDKNGGFFCTYRCNDTMLQRFACHSNNNGTSPAELQAVELAKKVSNGHLIYGARNNCKPTKGCQLFN